MSSDASQSPYADFPPVEEQSKLLRIMSHSPELQFQTLSRKLLSRLMDAERDGSADTPIYIARRIEMDRRELARELQRSDLWYQTDKVSHTPEKEKEGDIEASATALVKRLRAALHKFNKANTDFPWIMAIDEGRFSCIRNPSVKAISGGVSIENRVAFEQFFGCPVENAAQGRIIVAADSIETLIDDLRRTIQNPIEPSLRMNFDLDELSESRFFKARTLLNRWDSEAALFIREELYLQVNAAPKIIYTDHGDNDGAHEPPPFEISLGLGFTRRTSRAVQNCKEWFSNRQWPDCGDVVAIHPILAPKDNPTSGIRTNVFQGPLKNTEHQGFARVLPRTWNTDDRGRTYLGNWRKALEGRPDVTDYGVILRTTEIGITAGGKKRTQISLVAAGFTERGTKAAAMFLIQNWKALWRKYVKNAFREDGTMTPSRGDFFLVIAGPSLDQSSWKRVRGFTILPRTFRRLALRDVRLKSDSGSSRAFGSATIDCDWLRRYPRIPSQPPRPIPKL